jgi:hypothetical protein
MKEYISWRNCRTNETITDRNFTKNDAHPQVVQIQSQKRFFRYCSSIEFLKLFYAPLKPVADEWPSPVWGDVQLRESYGY